MTKYKILAITSVFIWSTFSVSVSYAEGGAGHGRNELSVLCSSQNRSPILLTLNRIAIEKKQHGQDVTGIATLKSMIETNPSLVLTEDSLKNSGLNKQEIGEVFQALSYVE